MFSKDRPVRPEVLKRAVASLREVWQDVANGAFMAAFHTLFAAIAARLTDLVPTSSPPAVRGGFAAVELTSIFLSVLVWLAWCRRLGRVVQKWRRLLVAAVVLCLVIFLVYWPLPSSWLPSFETWWLLCALPLVGLVVPCAIAFGRPKISRTLGALVLYILLDLVLWALIDPVAETPAEVPRLLFTTELWYSISLLTYYMVVASWAVTGKSFGWFAVNQPYDRMVSTWQALIALTWLVCWPFVAVYTSHAPS